MIKKCVKCQYAHVFSISDFISTLTLRQMKNAAILLKSEIANKRSEGRVDVWRLMNDGVCIGGYLDNDSAKKAFAQAAQDIILKEYGSFGLELALDKVCQSEVSSFVFKYESPSSDR